MQLIDSNKFWLTILLDAASIIIQKILSIRMHSPLEELKIRKKTDTIFILGTGPSINEVSEKGWEKISNYDSLGINFFCLHKFTPNYLSFEDSEILEKQPNIDLQFRILNEKALTRKDLLFLERDVSFFRLVGLNCNSMESFKFPSRVLKFGRFRVSAATAKQFNARFQLIHRLLTRFNISCLISVRSSVVSIAEICVRLGYKNIVFVGVDLNSVRYFYYEGFYPSTPKQLQRTGKHMTEDNIKSFYNTSSVLSQLATLRSSTTKFFTISSRSELAKYFDVYDLDGL